MSIITDQGYKINEALLINFLLNKLLFGLGWNSSWMVHSWYPLTFDSWLVAVPLANYRHQRKETSTLPFSCKDIIKLRDGWSLFFSTFKFLYFESQSICWHCWTLSLSNTSSVITLKKIANTSYSKQNSLTICIFFLTICITIIVTRSFKITQVLC